MGRQGGCVARAAAGWVRGPLEAARCCACQEACDAVWRGALVRAGAPADSGCGADQQVFLPGRLVAHWALAFDDARPLQRADDAVPAAGRGRRVRVCVCVRRACDGMHTRGREPVDQAAASAARCRRAPAECVATPRHRVRVLQELATAGREVRLSLLSRRPATHEPAHPTHHSGHSSSCRMPCRKGRASISDWLDHHLLQAVRRDGQCLHAWSLPAVTRCRLSKREQVWTGWAPHKTFPPTLHPHNWQHGHPGAIALPPRQYLQLRIRPVRRPTSTSAPEHTGARPPTPTWDPESGVPWCRKKQSPRRAASRPNRPPPGRPSRRASCGMSTSTWGELHARWPLNAMPQAAAGIARRAPTPDLTPCGPWRRLGSHVASAARLGTPRSPRCWHPALPERCAVHGVAAPRAGPAPCSSAALPGRDPCPAPAPCPQAGVCHTSALHTVAVLRQRCGLGWGGGCE